MKKIVLILTLIFCVSFSTPQDEINDGVYTGTMNKKAAMQSSTSSSTRGGGFNSNMSTVKPDDFSDDVSVEIKNKKIIAIKGFRYAFPEKEFVNKPVVLDKRGSLSLEYKQFEKDASNRNDPGFNYTYKLKVSKKSLLVNLQTEE